MRFVITMSCQARCALAGLRRLRLKLLDHW